MKKIAVIINSPLYVRNYIETDVLNELTKSYNVSIILRDGVELADKVPNAAVFKYSIEESIEKYAQDLMNLSMFKYRNRSSSFRFRLERGSVRAALFNILKSGTISNFIINIARFPRYAAGRIKLKIKMLLTSNQKHQLYLKNLPISRSLENVLMTTKPDLVLLPSAAYQVEDGVVPKIARNHGIKSFFLIDNWDNLSSKSIILDFPDLIGVWGEQSKKHAIDIQGIPHEKITVLGTPRFDAYFRLRDKQKISNFSFPYVLFVGTSLSFNEAKVLQIIDKEITANQAIYGDLKVVYRPHPWRSGVDDIRSFKLQNVIVDPQVSKNYFSRQFPVTFQPSLDYYPSLFMNAKFIIGGLTSMLIESLIFYKKFIGIAHHEILNTASPDRVLSEYVHFKEINKLSMIELCHSLADLPIIFRSNFYKYLPSSELSADQKKQIDLERNYFLFSDDASYLQRLIDDIDVLLYD